MLHQRSIQRGGDIWKRVTEGTHSMIWEMREGEIEVSLSHISLNICAREMNARRDTQEQLIWTNERSEGITEGQKKSKMKKHKSVLNVVLWMPGYISNLLVSLFLITKTIKETFELLLKIYYREFLKNCH